MDTEQEAGAEWDKVANAIAADTNVGHEIPLPVKRDEHGPIKEQTIKQLLAKVNEELDELKAGFLLALINEKAEMAEKVLNIPDDVLPDGNALPYIAEEAADTIVTITTLCEAIGIDEEARTAAIARVNAKNRERGRL